MILHITFGEIPLQTCKDLAIMESKSDTNKHHMLGDMHQNLTGVNLC